MIDIALLNKIKTLTLLPVEQGKIDFDKPGSRVWFQRSSSNTDLFCNGKPSMFDDVFMVEVITEDIDATQLQADKIKAGLNGFRGVLFGEFRYILGMFVSDAADEYEPKNLSADEGFFVQAFEVRILS